MHARRGLELRAKRESGRLRMAWTLEGTYFENCSCDTICPCTWSALTAKATHDRCKAMLAFHIDRGDIDGVNVSGLTFALVADTPPVMSDGGWKLGVVVDAAASEAQAGGPVGVRGRGVGRAAAGVPPPLREVGRVWVVAGGGA